MGRERGFGDVVSDIVEEGLAIMTGADKFDIIVRLGEEGDDVVVTVDPGVETAKEDRTSLWIEFGMSVG